MVLNRMYHCAPSAISTMPPMFRLVPVAMNTAMMNGNKKLAGKLASTCTSGCAERATRGFIPIFTPIGHPDQSTPMITITTTRRNV